jgi:hypothetical protein
MATVEAIGIDIGRSQIKAAGLDSEGSHVRFHCVENVLLTQLFYLTLRCFLQKNT